MTGRAACFAGGCVIGVGMVWDGAVIGFLLAPLAAVGWVACVVLVERWREMRETEESAWRKRFRLTRPPKKDSPKKKEQP